MMINNKSTIMFIPEIEETVGYNFNKIIIPENMNEVESDADTKID